MVRGNYKRSNYMALKQASKVVVNEGSGWRTAVEAVTPSANITEVELLVDHLLSANPGEFASFRDSQERSIGLLFAAEAARV